MTLLHHHSPIDANDLTSNVRSFSTCQERDGGGDLLRLAEAPQWNVRLHGLFDLVVQPLSHVGRDKAGRDDVAGDALAGKLAGNRLGEADQPCFAGGVISLTCVTRDACDAADVDDPATL